MSDIEDFEARRGPIEAIPFLPWHEDVRRIARLYRWLILLGERPENVADFIEKAEDWKRQYEEMKIFEADD